MALAEIWLFFPYEQAIKLLFIENQGGYRVLSVLVQETR